MQTQDPTPAPKTSPESTDSRRKWIASGLGFILGARVISRVFGQSTSRSIQIKAARGAVARAKNQQGNWTKA